MLELQDDIKITDKNGFVYRVSVNHHPSTGVSIAYYEGARIASREYGRIIPPAGDNDREWEEWEERFREWADGAISDLKLECENYFNKN